jgi:hypothetical protein
MNDPDNFLNRWSRRKQEAGERKDKDKDKDEAGKAPADSPPESEAGASVPAPDAPPTPKFDLESLPPIESINADTDITAFMQAGVPEALKRAALRRVWTADPAIRDFVGLNENFWDAAGPDGIAGFGDLDPNFDVKRMLSELFGEVPRQDASSDADAGRVANSSALPVSNQSEAAGIPPSDVASVADLSQRNENAAAQTEPTDSVPEKKLARRHGRAMPQ